MHVDLYERIWMWGATAIIAVFLISIGVTTFSQVVVPPSHIETIDPDEVRSHSEFGDPGVTIHADGSATVVVQAIIYAFLPREIRVPRGEPVTFRITSPDLIHGFQIAQTNGNAMVVPGYVTQFTTIFEKSGEYLIVCNEYCGLGHHNMFGTLIVEDSPSAAAGAEQ